MIIDTHAHLDFPEFAGDIEAVIARAAEVGVTRIVTVGTSVEGSRRAVALAEQYPSLYAVIGIHPNSVMEAPPDAMDVLRELGKSPRVVAIGETGLDYYYLPGSQISHTKVEALASASARRPHEQLYWRIDITLSEIGPLCRGILALQAGLVSQSGSVETGLAG